VTWDELNDALTASNGHRARAAKLLGVAPQTVYRALARFPDLATRWPGTANLPLGQLRRATLNNPAPPLSPYVGQQSTETMDAALQARVQAEEERRLAVRGWEYALGKNSAKAAALMESFAHAGRIKGMVFLAMTHGMTLKATADIALEGENIQRRLERMNAKIEKGGSVDLMEQCALWRRQMDIFQAKVKLTAMAESAIRLRLEIEKAANEQTASAGKPQRRLHSRRDQPQSSSAPTSEPMPPTEGIADGG